MTENELPPTYDLLLESKLASEPTRTVDQELVLALARLMVKTANEVASNMDSWSATRFRRQYIRPVEELVRAVEHQERRRAPYQDQTIDALLETALSRNEQK